MIELFEFEFMRNAFSVVFLISIICGIIGTYVVIKRLIFISGGIAHASFGGIGLGYFLGLNPILTAIPFTILTSLGIGILNKKMNISNDSIIGIFWSVGMALGILFVFLTPGYAPDLFSYLFGNILTVSTFDLEIMAILDLSVLITVILLFEEFKAITFDEEFSKVVGLDSDKLYLLLLVLIGISVIVLIKVVGIILLIALLTIPASISKKYTYNIKWIMIYSIILGIIFTSIGLFLSYELNVPPGATIVLVSAFFFFLSYLFKKLWI